MNDRIIASPEVSIVVPVYRSERILPALVQQVEVALTNAGIADRFEIIFVCDASPDGSWDVIRSLASRFDFVRGICLRRNAGQHNATMAGLHFAKGAAIVVMDDDLQHPPFEIPRMLDELKRGFDVCYTRYRNRRHSWWKKAGSWINDRAATALLRKPRDLYLSSFKAMRREIALEIIKYDGPYAYLDGLILDVTSSISSIEIEHGERAVGVGNYTFGRSLSLWLKMATSFSIYPLRVLSFLGASLGIASIGAIFYIAIAKFQNPSIQTGWASLIATILFVGGVQLIGLGLIGEYLGRVYIKLNRRPQFVVRSDTNSTETNSDFRTPNPE